MEQSKDERSISPSLWVCALATRRQPRRTFTLGCRSRCFPKEVGDHFSVGFAYKPNLVWYEIHKDGGPDGREVGFQFRNVTELILFGTLGKALAQRRRGGGRSICPARANASTAAGLTTCMTLSKHVAPPRASISSRAVRGRAGRHGAIMLDRATRPGPVRLPDVHPSPKPVSATP